jgi:hypothetical protein
LSGLGVWKALWSGWGARSLRVAREAREVLQLNAAPLELPPQGLRFAAVLRCEHT